MNQDCIVSTVFKDLAHHINDVMRKKGFWNGTFCFAEKIALMHTELSQALEANRKDSTQRDEHCPDFTTIEIELADTIIRILDLVGFMNLDIGGAIKAKMAFNETRPYKHEKSY